MKTILNSFYSFNFSRQDRYFQNYQQSALRYQQVDHRQSNDQLMFFRVFRALRLQNIMMYDFIKHSIGFFIRRFKQIAKIKEFHSVLRVLFFCLKNDVLKWHNDLSSFIQLKINDSLAVWKNELFRKYRSNRFDSIKKVQQMLFRFDKNTTLN